MLLTDWWNTVRSAIKPATTPTMKVATQPGETAIYLREKRVRELLEKLLPGQPWIMNGHYSWLLSPLSGEPLQIDIFFPRIEAVAGVPLARPRCLAVEVQSTLHDGKWDRGKRFWFRTRAEFDHYTENQEWKRRQLRTQGIPFLEIDPDTDPMTTMHLRKAVGGLFDLVL